MSIDAVSERLGSIDSRLAALEGWLEDHQGQDRDHFGSLEESIDELDRKIDEIIAGLAVQKGVAQEAKKTARMYAMGAAAALTAAFEAGKALFFG